MIAALKAKIRSKITNDKHFAELIKGSGVAFILRIVGIAAGYLFTLLVTRNLGAKAWGIFSLSLVVLQIASVIGRLGMDTALLRFTAEYTARGDVNTLKEIYKKALTLIVSFSVLIAILVYILSPFLANKVFHKPYLTNYFRLVSFITVPFILLLVHSEAIRGLKKIKEYMFLQQVGTFAIALILLLGGLIFFKSNFLPLVSYGISIFFLSVISIYLWHKYFANFFVHSTLSTIFKTSTTSYRFILSISIPMLFSSSLALIMGWTDTIMLGIFRNAQEVGVYNVVLRVSMITSITLMAINIIAAPKFAEFWGKGDIEGLTKIAKQSTKLIFWTSLPMLLLFLLFPGFVLGMFGEEFNSGILALKILVFGQFLNAIFGSVGYILMMTGHQRFHQNTILIGTFGNFVLNYVLVPKYGITGAAFASAMSTIFWNISFTLKVRSLLKEFIFYIPIIRRN